jgi:hypothetical protein
MLLEALKRKILGVNSGESTPAVKSPVIAPVLTHQDSSIQYHMPNQTLIILDYDDSLCPSSWIRKNRPTLNYFEPCPNIKEYKEPLERLAKEVCALLTLANSLGKLVILTNAQQGWVETSCKNFMPPVLEVINRLKIDIVYARSTVEFPDRLMPQSWKEKAMQIKASEFYSQYQQQSWKNVISVGDQTCDLEALKIVADSRPTKGKLCRTKTVKLIEDPEVDTLVKEVSWLIKNIKPIVSKDSHVNMNLRDEI